MATVKIDTFHGIAPLTHPSLLADGMAVTAHNCKLETGKLVPLRQPRIVGDVSILMENGLSDIAKAQTMHFWEKKDGSGEFLLFPGVTWMADGNLADDDRTRVVVSGDTGVSAQKFVGTDEGTGEDVFEAANDVPTLYYRTPAGTRRAYPLPKNAPPAPCVYRANDRESPVVPLDESKDRRYTYFFLTWVDHLGYESPVSSPSKAWNGKSGDESAYVDGDLVYNDGDTVSVDMTATGDVWNDIRYANIRTLRVYKVVTGTDEGRIQFIKEFSKEEYGSATVLSFAVKDEDAGEVLAEIEGIPWDLRCVTNVPGAFYAGFSPSKPKTVCFSEVDLLYSWPTAYQYDVTDNIVALAATSNTVFVLTDGWPYVLSGTAPEAMTVTKLAGPASCVSPRGVCVYKNALYFVGQQGLMTVYNSADAGTVCENLTARVFTKEQWQEKNPASCVMGQFDGALMLFFTHRDGTHEALRIGLADGVNAVTTNDEVAKCVCTDNKTDKMYFVREGV